MDREKKREINRWSRDLIVSLAIVPGFLAALQMSATAMIIGGLLSIAILKAWENKDELKDWFSRAFYSPRSISGVLIPDPKGGPYTLRLNWRGKGTGFFFLFLLIGVAAGLVLISVGQPYMRDIIAGPEIALGRFTAPKDRVFVTFGPEHLIEPFSRLTAAEANRTVTLHSGKWMRIHQQIGEVMPADEFTGTVQVVLDKGMFTHSTVLCIFERGHQADLASSLQKGNSVRVVGQIDQANSLGLVLFHCEFE